MPRWRPSWPLAARFRNECLEVEHRFFAFAGLRRGELELLQRVETARWVDLRRTAGAGTPVENDLDDLWSLFAFVNPGLLGGRDAFARRFSTPIARDGDARARAALRALVRPFLLRRTKAEVLSELPPRTEQTLLVEQEPEERARPCADARSSVWTKSGQRASCIGDLDDQKRGLRVEPLETDGFREEDKIRFEIRVFADARRRGAPQINFAKFFIAELIRTRSPPTCRRRRRSAFG